MRARALPDWPRMLPRALAAAYCGLTTAGLEREVAAGRLPMPVQLDGEPHWCRRALDTSLDCLTTGRITDWRQAGRDRMRGAA